MKSQAMGDTRSMEYMKGRKILEISPTSPVILDMKSKVEGDDKSEDVMDAVRLLYETSMITSGFEVPDPTMYASRVYKMMGFNVEASRPAAAAAAAGDGGAPVEAEVIAPEEGGADDDPWKN